MEQQGKQALVMAKLSHNPVQQLQLKYKELEEAFKAWLAKQSLPVEAAVVSVTSAVQGGAMGAIMGTLTTDLSSSMPTPPQGALDPKSMASFQQAQALAGGPLVQARNFAVMTGANAGISCVMRRLRGKDDVQSSMVAAFGSGALFSLVSGMGGPNPATNAITSGLFFALVQGGLFKLGENFSRKPVEDPNYVRAKSMLDNLGLQSYEKNFKKGLLTDETLPLLNDRQRSERCEDPSWTKAPHSQSHSQGPGDQSCKEMIILSFCSAKRLGAGVLSLIEHNSFVSFDEIVACLSFFLSDRCYLVVGIRTYRNFYSIDFHILGYGILSL
ncbi:hypothetical protein Tsubulata_000030 [Turnera subulata]|uniref:Uncharacterized protein n=1 Tax=Turnera subulata TaxID=218843 RepID=A0A9Q0J9E1_9ROSI|nr:hypothetical protein Tsubulata_000030 [Turnera subulata]